MIFSAGKPQSNGGVTAGVMGASETSPCRSQAADITNSLEIYGERNRPNLANECADSLKPSLNLSALWLRRGLLLRSQRFFHPTVKLLLMGFDPTVDVAPNIGF